VNRLTLPVRSTAPSGVAVTGAAAAKPGPPPRTGVGVAVAAGCIALLFGLPHLVIPALLGPDRPYTPFALQGVSALTYDESYAYASQVNYTRVRWLPAYDTDTYEARLIPSPLAVAPIYFLAALARVTGGVESAFILCDFLLPAVAFLLLYRLLADLTHHLGLALLGSSVTLLVTFGPRNFLRTPVELLATGATSATQPLEYSRLLHPQFSFTLLLGALFLLWRALRHGSLRTAAVAGLLGGLLFYTYVYYWPIWTGACALLLCFALVADRRRLGALCVVNVLTWLISIPFWATLYAAYQTPNFRWFMGRFVSGFEQGYAVPLRDQLIYSFIYIFVFLFCTSLLIIHIRRMNYTKREDSKRYIILLSSLFIAALASMNSDLLTGIDLETMIHFPNRFFQPFFGIVFFACLLPSLSGYLPAVARNRRHATLACCAGMALLLAAGVARQVAVSHNVASRHEFRPDQRSLFAWLDRHTAVDDVVVASDMYVNALVPVYTRDRPFVPCGGRTTISDEDIERRYLIAMKLLGHDAEAIRQILARKAPGDDPSTGFTYTYYLFQAGYGQVDRGLPVDRLDQIGHRYRALDLARELGRWRLDYVYVERTETLQQVPGWSFVQVAVTPAGSVWHVRPEPQASSGGSHDATGDASGPRPW
jgi:hypothetical protein